jgi:hypothetical protein
MELNIGFEGFSFSIQLYLFKAETIKVTSLLNSQTDSAHEQQKLLTLIMKV